jgi:hypothetical protein
MFCLYLLSYPQSLLLRLLSFDLQTFAKQHPFSVVLHTETPVTLLAYLTVQRTYWLNKHLENKLSTFLFRRLKIGFNTWISLIRIASGLLKCLPILYRKSQRNFSCWCVFWKPQRHYLWQTKHLTHKSNIMQQANSLQRCLIAVEGSCYTITEVPRYMVGGVELVNLWLCW